MEQNEVLLILRELLDRSDRAAAWAQVFSLVEHLPVSLQSVAIDYIQGHTSGWSLPTDFVGHYRDSALLHTPGQPSHSGLMQLLQGERRPWMSLVRTLNLRRKIEDVEVFRRLLDNEELGSVTHLDLCGNCFPEGPKTLLYDAPLLHNLRFLGVAGIWSADVVGMRDQIKKCLLHPSLEGIEQLLLSQQELLRWVISPAMSHLSRLTHLRMAGAALERQTLRRLARVPHLSGLRCLVLNDCQIHKEALHAFLQELSLEALEELHLDRVRSVEDVALRHIAENPACERLKVLSLSGSQVSIEGIQRCLRSPYLGSLELIRASHVSEEDTEEWDELKLEAAIGGVRLAYKPLLRESREESPVRPKGPSGT